MLKRFAAILNFITITRIAENKFNTNLKAHKVNVFDMKFEKKE